jgi:1-acyl-sn-glycerol-3-phosphate acyltransferase
MNVPTPIRRGARVAGFGALTAAMLPGMIAHAEWTRSRGGAVERVRDRWVGVWCGAMLDLFGIEVVSDATPLEQGKPRLIVSNHRSTADILILLRTFGGRMVSRADLASWPLIGLAARSAGTVFVDRADAASGATALRTMVTHLATGSSIVVFPEGTTFPDDEVRPFHPGAFVAAARAGAEVVPVGLAYERGSGAAFFGETFPAHLSRMAGASPSRVALCAGPALTPGDRGRSRDLLDRSHAAVQALVTHAREIVDGRR